MCLLILGIAGQRVGSVHHAVTLDIGFGYQINAVFIAQIIPARIIGIVAGADCVDVHLLHYLNILDHTLQRYHISAVGIHLVTVGTLYEYGLSVYQQLAVTDLNLTESHLLRNNLQYFSIGLLKSHVKGIEIRSLGGPFVRISYLEGELYGTVCNGL